MLIMSTDKILGNRRVIKLYLRFKDLYRISGNPQPLGTSGKDGVESGVGWFMSHRVAVA